MRGRSNRKVLITVLGLVFLAVQAYAEDATVLKTDKEKTNYAIGANIIGSIRQQGVEIDLDLVIKGMRDAYSGGKMLLSEEEIRTGIDQYQIAVKQKRSQKMAKASEENRKAGEAFLAENGKKEGVVTLPSGLQYKILKAGSGKKPSDTDTVECNYRGTLINGTEFDSSIARGQPATFKVDGVIPGWTEALQLMKEGDKWQLFIPAELAYGERGAPPRIPPQSILVFEVELISVQ